MDRLRALEIFVRVAECGSFNKAARSLDVSNATVTSCLANLERHLGVTLIQRNTRFVSLTEEGGHLLSHAVAILESMERAELEARGSRGEAAGLIRMESPVAIGHALVSPALPEFCRRNPGLTISLTFINSPRNMIEFGTDVALRLDHADDADLVARAVGDWHHMLCASPALVAREGLAGSPRDLRESLCLGILSEGSYAPRLWLLSRGEETVRLVPRGPLHCSSTDALIRAALEGMGVIYVLDAIARPYLEKGELVAVCPDWQGERRICYAVTPRGRFLPGRVRAFVHFLGEALGRAPPAARGRPVPVKALGPR